MSMLSESPYIQKQFQTMVIADHYLFLRIVFFHIILYYFYINITV